MKKRDEHLWLQGFAVAVATIYRCYHDDQMVESVMRENNVTVEELLGAEVLDADVEQIKLALSTRPKRPKRRKTEG